MHILLPKASLHQMCSDYFTAYCFLSTYAAIDYRCVARIVVGGICTVAGTHRYQDVVAVFAGVVGCETLTRFEGKARLSAAYAAHFKSSLRKCLVHRACQCDTVRMLLGMRGVVAR